jgi:lysophospholipase L1-like esterase
MIGRMLSWILRGIGAAVGALAALVTVQLLRLRRTEFLPLLPGFYISHWVEPDEPRAAERSTLRLLTFGDSTTAGVGVDHPEDALPMLIARHVANAEQATVRVVNFGWSGARVADLVRDQLARATRSLRDGEPPWLPGADIVVVVVGANDATHRTAPRRFRADTRRVLEILRREAPGARVVLAGIPRFRGALPQLEPLLSVVDAYAILLRRIQRQEAERAGVAYASLAEEVPPLLIASGASVDDVLAADRFHPSPLGYRLWAEVINAALERA